MRHIHALPAICLVLTACASVQPALQSPQVVPENTAKARSLVELVAGSDMVLLGESMHLTRELSLARIPVIRSLATEAGFNLLAFEGSMAEAWIGMDRAFAEPSAAAAAKAFQKPALFNLWQTEEVRQALTTALAPEPALYLTSYDVQMGQGSQFVRGKSILGALLERLALRGAIPDERSRTKILLLDRLALCKAKRFPSTPADAAATSEGIAALEKLVSRIPPFGQGRLQEFHERTLRFLPESLRHEAKFCEEARSFSGSYVSLRDRHAARQFASYLSTLQPLKPKSMVWAHAGHVRMASPPGKERFGGIIGSERAKLPVAIAFSAVEGQAVIFQKPDGGEVEPYAADLLSLEKVSLERKLATAGVTDQLIDLCQGPAASLLAESETMRSEPDGLGHVQPCKDFQALSLVGRATPPQWDFQ